MKPIEKQLRELKEHETKEETIQKNDTMNYLKNEKTFYKYFFSKKQSVSTNVFDLHSSEALVWQ